MPNSLCVLEAFHAAKPVSVFDINIEKNIRELHVSVSGPCFKYFIPLHFLQTNVLNLFIISRK